MVAEVRLPHLQSVENMNPGAFVLFEIVGKGTNKHVNTLTSNVTKRKTSRQIIFVFF